MTHEELLQHYFETVTWPLYKKRDMSKKLAYIIFLEGVKTGYVWSKALDKLGKKS